MEQNTQSGAGALTVRQNQTPASILKNMLMAAAGLVFFGSGLYLTIHAGIGVAPWDTFTIGISQVLGVRYGTASILISGIIIAIDLLLRERIGVGTVLDALLVGKTVDLLDWLALVPPIQSTAVGILTMLVGLFIMGLSQSLYMRAALCCGPRDALLVALGKRLSRVPIGGVSIGILCIVLFAGWRLGGPIGIGTLVAALCSGPLMQLAFKLTRFDPLPVVHQSIVETAQVVFRKKV